MERPDTSPIILQIDNPDLTADSAAQRAVKNEKVLVEFAHVDGELISSVGVNRYFPGDALITGSTGDRWSVSRDRFDAKYVPEPPTVGGAPGNYRNRPAAVLAKRIDQAFAVARSVGGDTLYGNAGDWLIQYAPGDFGIVENARFKRVYVLVADESR
jgi:hypothetical protein